MHSWNILHQEQLRFQLRCCPYHVLEEEVPLVLVRSIAGVGLLRPEASGRVALAGRSADENIDALPSDQSPHRPGLDVSDVPDDNAIIRDLRMVKTVGFHRLRILIDRKQNPEACPG